MKLKKLLGFVLAIAMVLSLMPAAFAATETADVWDGTTVASEFASGDGTELNPYIVETGAQLAYLAQQVNSGTTYSGQYVKLDADIDLNNKDWTPIGTNGDAYYFAGSFDGGNYTVSNLYIKQGAAYHAAALFGAIRGTLKNLIIDGAYVENLSSGSATVNGTAVAVGCSYNYPSFIENVHVKNATVKANRYVAGIVGYMDGYVTSCSVENITLVATPDKLTGSYDNGDKVGGIVAYTNSNAVSISGCVLKGTNSITGYRDIGGIVGMVQSNAVISNNTNNSQLTITVDQSTNSYGAKDPNVGEFIGRGTAHTNSAGNTTAEDASYKAEIKYVASIGETKYTSLKDAVAEGGEITLLQDVTVNETINVTKDVTLDLNGKTITNGVEGARAFEVTQAVKFTVEGTTADSAMLIPESNTGACGFVRLNADGAELVVNGGTYTGNTDNGMLFRGNTDIAGKITLNNVNASTNWVVVGLSSSSETVAIDVDGGTFIINTEASHATKYAASVVEIVGGEGSTLTMDGVRATINTVNDGSVDGLGCYVQGEVKATLTDCTIEQTGSAHNNHAPSTAIAAAVGATIDLNSTSYTGFSRSVYVYPTGGTVNIKGGTYSGNVVSHINSAANNTVANSVINIEDGNINGALEIIRQPGNNGYTASIVVSGGAFTVNPTAYVASGYTATYADGVYKVSEKQTTSTTVETTVSTGTSSGTVSSENFEEGSTAHEAATTVAGKVEDVTSTNTQTQEDLALATDHEDNAVTEDAIVEAVKEVVGDGVDVSDDVAEALDTALTQNGINTTGETVTVVVQPYLDIVVTDVAVENSAVTSIEVDITPMVNIVATTESVVNDEDGEIRTEGDDPNAVVLASKEMKVEVPVTISIPLPNGFANVGDTIYVVHTKTDNNGKFVAQYVYEAEVEETGGNLVATFTNPNGFSTFSLRSTEPVASAFNSAGTLIGSYDTLQAAVNADGAASVTILSNVATSAAVVINKTITIDLKGFEVKTTDVDGNGVFWVQTGGNLTLEDSSQGKTGMVNGVGGDITNGYHMAIWADGGNVVINGGTYTNVGASGGSTADQYDLIYVKNNGSVTINGGTFKCQTPRWTLNVRNETDGTITVKGGSFLGFDPAGANTDDTIPEGGSNPVNYVAEGYEVKESAGYYNVSRKVVAPAGPSLYTIKVAASENGKASARAIAASKGSKITITATPDEGYVVDSIVVTDAAGNELEIIEHNGKPAFVMPASKVTVTVTFVYDLPFADVAEEYVEAVSYMHKAGLMIGTSAEEEVFSGEMTMTRAQIAMILYRLAGEPAAEYAGTFTDVAEGQWYTAAVEWAASEGIVNGVGDGIFAHGRTITVVELAALVYRYAQCQLTGECVSSDWVTESAAAMTWCEENGVLAEGTDGSATASRYLAAEMFYAVSELVK